VAITAANPPDNAAASVLTATAHTDEAVQWSFVGRRPLEADLVRVAAMQGLPIVPEENTESGWYYRSDHYGRAQKGVRGV
jgi:hypothetical protein